MEWMDYIRGQERIKKGPEEGVKERYSRISIDLSSARTDEPINITGDYLAIASCTGAATTTYFKLNHINSRPIYPAEIEKLYASYNKIYLTNAAESGKTLVVYVGGALSGEIKTSAAGATKLKTADGTDINPATSDAQATMEADIEAIYTNMAEVDSDVLMTKDIFTGACYSLSKASSDTATLIEATAMILHDCVITNTHASYEVLLGDDNTPEYKLAGGASLGFRKIDLNTVYLKSNDAGEHATLHIIGSRYNT